MTVVLPVVVATLGPWRFRAACRTVDPGLFFPGSGCLSNQAKQICSTCPVRDQCLNHALTAGEWYGIWGGTTAQERQRIRKSTAGAANTEAW